MAAMRSGASRMFLIMGGIIYFVLWIYGLVAVGNDQLNFVPVNDADNWLHLVLALGMVLLGVFVNREPRVAPGSAWPLRRRPLRRQLRAGSSAVCDGQHRPERAA